MGEQNGQVDREVGLIYYQDGQDWAAYIQSELGGCGMSIKIVDFEREIPEPSGESLRLIQKGPIAMILLTHSFIIKLSETADLKKLISTQSRGIIILLGENSEAVESWEVKQYLPECDGVKWRLKEYNDDWKVLRSTIARMYEEAKNDGVKSPTPTAPPRSRKKPSSDKKQSIERNTMTITPNKARCECRTEVVLHFEKPVESETVIVFMLSRQDEQEVIHIKASEVRRLNPYTYKFTAPEHCPDTMSVKAMAPCTASEASNALPTQSQLSGRFRCEASAELEYVNRFYAIDALNHILLHVASSAFKVLYENRMVEEIKQLDSSLCEALFDNEEHNISTSGFELLFGQYEWAAAEAIPVDVPTMLHLAARFGLIKLTRKLLDLPGSALANSLTNLHEQHPADVAAQHGFKEVKQVLDKFTEDDMKEYDVYVEMFGYKTENQIPSYVRKYYNQINHMIRSGIQPVDYVDREDYMTLAGLNSEKGKTQPCSRSEADAEYYDDYTNIPEDVKRIPYKRFNTLPANTDSPKMTAPKALPRRPSLQDRPTNLLTQLTEEVYRGENAHIVGPSKEPPVAAHEAAAAPVSPSSPTSDGMVSSASAPASLSPQQHLVGIIEAFKKDTASIGETTQRFILWQKQNNKRQPALNVPKKAKPQVKAKIPVPGKGSKTFKKEPQNRESSASNSSETSIDEHPPTNPRGKRVSVVVGAETNEVGPPPGIPPRAHQSKRKPPRPARS